MLITVMILWMMTIAINGDDLCAGGNYNNSDNNDWGVLALWTA